jgi:hypothetical protein
MFTGMMKVGLSMIQVTAGAALARHASSNPPFGGAASCLQIIASGNSAYNIKWPSAFEGFMDFMKLFLVVCAF